MPLPFQPDFVTVIVSEEPTPFPPSLIPPVTFEARWEREGKWLLGPNIISAIARYLQDKSIVAIRSHDDPSRIDLVLPELLKVRNEADGEMVSIYWMIPKELRRTFELCCCEVMSYRCGDLELLRDQLIGAPITDFTLSNANSMLASFEAWRRQRADPNDPELWQILAERCGLDWRFLPRTSFASDDSATK